MSVPCRFATCQMVSSARASTSWPSRVNFTLLLIASPLILKTVGWVEPSGPAFGRPNDKLGETHRHDDGFRFAQPILRFIASPTPQRLPQLVRKILHYAHQRVRPRLAESANRCIPHGARQLAEQRLVPRAGRHQLRGLFGARPAGGALAAALILAA